MGVSGKAGSFVELVVTIVIVMALFPTIAASVADVTGDDGGNYSVGTIAIAGIIDLILMAGLIFFIWKRAT